MADSSFVQIDPDPDYFIICTLLGAMVQQRDIAASYNFFFPPVTILAE